MLLEQVQHRAPPAEHVLPVGAAVAGRVEQRLELGSCPGIFGVGEHGLDVAPARHREQLDVVRQQAAQRDPLAGGQEPAGCLLGVQADVGVEI